MNEVSPCKTCTKDCTETCKPWEEWFSKKWREIQKLYGKNEVQKDGN